MDERFQLDGRLPLCFGVGNHGIADGAYLTDG